MVQQQLYFSWYFVSSVSFANSLFPQIIVASLVFCFQSIDLVIELLESAVMTQSCILDSMKNLVCLLSYLLLLCYTSR